MTNSRQWQWAVHERASKCYKWHRIVHLDAMFHLILVLHWVTLDSLVLFLDFATDKCVLLWEWKIKHRIFDVCALVSLLRPTRSALTQNNLVCKKFEGKIYIFLQSMYFLVCYICAEILTCQSKTCRYRRVTKETKYIWMCLFLDCLAVAAWFYGNQA